MYIHILGICGTFMAGIATLAKQQGHHVTGSDINIYPPMSIQLKENNINILEGHESLPSITPDYFIIGNSMTRGMPIIEEILNKNLPYISGPQWLAENILRDRWVLTIAGTHGKTTTSSMLAWILQDTGLNPGFLIGGIPQNFLSSTQLGKSPFFVIEADEYDTAFFDKRSKFIHYHPRTTILNNLEYDHADIFPDLNAIKTQFHHFVRTIPGNGLIICPSSDKNLKAVLDKGCWTPIEYLGENWQVQHVATDGSQFDVHYNQKNQGTVKWSLLGQHNVQNALAAIAAARHADVEPARAIAALTKFLGVKRRLEIRGIVDGVTIYDDFAHHPTAIATTLQGLRNRVGKQRIIAVVELGSYTMRTGVHKDTLAPALKDADSILLARPKEDWGINAVAKQLNQPTRVCDDVAEIIDAIKTQAKAGDHVLIMSNTGFGGIYEKLLQIFKTSA